MALVLKDRVKETTTTTGTGTIDLAGAATGFEGFVSAVGSGNSCYYAILDANDSAWEVGTGTVTDAATDTLSRDTVLESSNSDSKVDLSAGTHTVFLTYPADKSVYRNTNDQIVVTASGIVFSDDTVQTTAPVDTNTTYTAGTGLLLSGTEFDVSGVDTSLLQGTVANNQLANSSVTITAGTGLSNGGSVALGGSVSIDVDHGSIDHDSLNNFVANEHIDHTSVTLTAGSGLAGGGDISANRTFHVSGVDVSLLQGMDANGELIIGGTSGPAVSTLTQGSNVTITNADGGITIAAADTTYTAGTGIVLSGTEINVGYIIQDNPALILTENITRLGNSAGEDCGTGNNNVVMVGDHAGAYSADNTTTTMIGTNAGWLSSGNAGSIFMGFQAGRSTALGEYNTYIGYQAGRAAGGVDNASYNTYIGRLAGYSASGSNNLEIISSGNNTSILNLNNNKVHIQKVIIGDSTDGKLAVGSVGASNLDPDATLEIVSANVNDTGLLVHNLIAAETGILLPSTVPAVTTNKLYNNGGALTFNGSAVNTTYTAGTGITLNGTEFDIDPTLISGRTEITSADADYLLVWDADDSQLKKVDAGEFRGGGGGGDITSVVAGSGLSGGGTTGDVTVNVSGVDTSLLQGTISSAQIANDAIDSQHYTDDSIDADHLANSINTDIATGVTAGTVAAAALPKAGGAMTGAITTNSTFDGVDIATRDGVLTTTTTTANAALPKAGGAMTGPITTNSTFDGVDIATRDAVLTSTTTTANAALPKAGGTMTGTLTVGVDGTGKDVKLYGDTAGSYLEWDESEDRLNLVGGAYVNEAVPANDTPTTEDATVTLDLSLGNYHNIVLGVNVNKFEFTNAKRGQRFILRITQHASSAKTVGWTNVDSATDVDATLKWAGNITPTMSTTVSNIDVYGFLCTNNTGTIRFDGFIIGQDIPA
jgi:hypothetical protein